MRKKMDVANLTSKKLRKIRKCYTSRRDTLGALECMWRHRRYAHMLVKKGLSNIEDLDRLFAGKTANGEREFSTAMARNKVYGLFYFV
ncbi:hypothetical protein OROGR_023543 [Orobanche gracilis]